VGSVLWGLEAGGQTALWLQRCGAAWCSGSSSEAGRQRVSICMEMLKFLSFRSISFYKATF